MSGIPINIFVSGGLWVLPIPTLLAVRAVSPHSPRILPAFYPHSTRILPAFSAILPAKIK